MRFSPDRRFYVCERGQHPSDGVRRLTVCDAATGAVLDTFLAGFNPRWVDDGVIVAESPTGASGTEGHAQWAVEIVPANRGQLDANGHGVWAVSDLSATMFYDPEDPPLRVLHARDPRISAAGELAVRHPQTGDLSIPMGPQFGPCEDARWGSDTLVWWLGGRVWGRTTPDVPTTELTIAGRGCSHAVPCWHAQDGRLWVGLVLEDGTLAVVEWGRQDGYRVGQSDGSGFDHDLVEAGPGRLRYAYLDPLGVPVVTEVDTTQPTVSFAPPPPVTDTPWVTDPTGVIDDIAPWLFSANQGPDISFSADGSVRFFLKSDERSGDGPEPQIGEWWQKDAHYIGHLEDSSMGRRVYKGKPITPEQIVKLFPDTHAEVWASLPLYRNWWKDGARVWLPRRCTAGYSLKYTTDFLFNTGEKHPDVLIEIRVDVGHAVIHGRPVRVRGAYLSSPDHGKTWNGEINYYGPPDGANAWVAGPYPDNEPRWLT